MNGREGPDSHVRNLLSVEIKKCMYLAIFEVSWSSKREREREGRKELELNFEHSYRLVPFTTTIIPLYTPSALV